MGALRLLLSSFRHLVGCAFLMASTLQATIKNRAFPQSQLAVSEKGNPLLFNLGYFSLSPCGVFAKALCKLKGSRTLLSGSH